MPTRAITRPTLYGDVHSGNCLKPRWVADAVGYGYDWAGIDLLSGVTRTEEFLALNPAGQAPLLRLPDGRTLAQSNAIMLYIAETAGDGRFLPADPFRRAQMMAWLFWEQYSHEPYIAVRRWQRTFLGRADDELDPQLLARGRRALGVMELHLTAADYFVGEVLSLADVALVAYTRWAGEGGFDLGEFPAVQRWVRRVETDLAIGHAGETISGGRAHVPV
jgi:glutathione S-transferase